jgi:hypothetical protein
LRHLDTAAAAAGSVDVAAWIAAECTHFVIIAPLTQDKPGYDYDGLWHFVW